MDKYIVPPKLNRKHVVLGFTVWELFSLLALMLLFIFTMSGFVVFITASLAVLSFRPTADGIPGRNAGGFLMLLFQYFRTNQIYSLREVRDREL
jgi:hypothetical protein